MNWPQMRRPVRPPIQPGGQRRSRRLLLILAALVFVSFSGRMWLSYYVDALWFASLGYAQVFWKTLSLQSTIFITFAASTFLVLYGAFLVLKKTHFVSLPSSHTIFIGGQPLRLPVGSALRLLVLAGSTVIAVATGAVMMAEWPTFALYWYAPRTNAGVVDPIFGKPVGFYLFTLPAWQLVSGWLLLLAVIACAAAILFLLVKRASRALENPFGDHSGVSWSSLSTAFAFLLLVIALRVYLGRFDRLQENHTIFSGATYADAHVMLPGQLAICVTLVLGAVIALANAVWLQRGRWLGAAVVPAILCYLVFQVSGWYVKSFIVKPNELVRERPYITNNITATRQAYQLDRMSQREFPAETSVAAAEPAQNQETLQNIRLWDWRALQSTLRQIQAIRTYYDFPDVDIDRYEIDGNLREVMLATRELNIDKLPESSRNWINEKLIYTHGYGITMNSVNGFTPEGLPNLYLSNMPVQSSVPGLTVTRPEIYFGELTNSDVYVNTRQKEFNYPQGQTNSFTSYEANSGIVLNGFLRRILIAIDRGDLGKLPFSDDINSGSRLLMRRNVRDRVTALAPFFTFDQDPYIVIGEDSRLYWIMDAFTTSDNYPYSRHYRLDGDPINYIRNSAKVVIDAYDGTTTFYVFDAEDPVLAGYRRIFPALFKDAAAMPPGLRKHVRYPELLLTLQAEVYGLYHMTDPQMFYNREDLWNVASEVASNERGEQTAQTMEPNFVLMKLPDERALEFVEVLPFTPANRNNLIGWIAGRSDGPHYGTSIVYNFPKTKLVDGPLQIEARIDQNAQLSGQLTLWNQQGSHVRRGALLVIPCGRALLYAEPIYLQAERSPMPELRVVVLALQDRLAYGPTFESALASLFGGAPPSTSAEPAQPAKGAVASTQPPQSAADFNALIAEAAKDLADYQRLTAEGKLGEAGQKLEQLKRALDALNGRRK
ncbi:MAG TPA: UPF0182 family protein [Candidatus Angelobacter sp.]|nr:UPF0182 family protein [Candidatus Angelobacter sp.]